MPDYDEDSWDGDRDSGPWCYWPGCWGGADNAVAGGSYCDSHAEFIRAELAAHGEKEDDAS